MNEQAKVSGLESRLYHFITVLLHSQHGYRLQLALLSKEPNITLSMNT